MKVRTYTLLLSCLLVLLVGTSCTQESKVRKVATNYLEALVDYRLNDAKKYGDTSAIQFLDTQQRIIDSWTPQEREKARKAIENTKVKINSIEINDTKATVNYDLVKDGEILQSEKLYLIKKSSGWLVQEFM